MKLDIVPTGQFKKDIRRIAKQGKDMDELMTVIDLLAERKPLADKYRDHSLTGSYKNSRECHIRPDCLLVYRVENNNLILTLIRTGSHSELF